MADPNTVYVTCWKCTQRHGYEVAGIRHCQTPNCDNANINVSHVQRRKRPYLVWTANKAIDRHHAVIHVIPLTSSSDAEHVKGLPSTYPIRPSSKNGLTVKSFALVHQLTAVDARCLQKPKPNGNGFDWMERIGNIDRNDRSQIAERIRELFLPEEDDWFVPLMRPEHIMAAVQRFSPDEADALLEALSALLWDA